MLSYAGRDDLDVVLDAAHRFAVTEIASPGRARDVPSTKSRTAAACS
jgi:hypothetical protein